LASQQGRRAWSGRVALLASMVSGGAIALAWACIRLTPESAWPGSLLVQMPQWLWLAGPALLGIIAVFLRAWAATGVNLGALALASLTLGGLATGLGPGADRSPDQQRLRIVTWNVHNEHGHADAIRRRLIAYGPDIVCLQEAPDGVFDHLMPDWDVRRHGSVVIFSRHGIAGDISALTGHPDVERSVACRVNRGPLNVAVINVHLRTALGSHELAHSLRTLPRYTKEMAEVRARQFRAIQRNLPKGPTIVCGDFNTTPVAVSHRLFAQRMTDSYAATRFGLGLTYLVGKRIPTWRIDYIWCGDGAWPVGCFVGTGAPSDHRPVIADIALDWRLHRSVEGSTAATPGTAPVSIGR